MSDQYLGEIRMTGFNFAPQGWALCNGQTLAISQYNALFALIGTTYGGNGTTNFNLPNLQGRVPVHQGAGLNLPPAVIGTLAGNPSVTLLANNLPSHSHLIAPPVSNAAGTTSTPVGGFLAVDTITAAPVIERTTLTGKSYAAAATPGQTAGSYPSGVAGNNIPFDVAPPYLVVNFIIALVGIFPPRD
ncbi:MAG TPA: tail fiber protein [Acidobacteriaceae bacterium]|jgi:microcystin-dependent protein|nr:tail fiber protein [Acidobacteriaceae bacterium]